jgi:iron complex transport system ATP-binding protein
MKLLQGSSLSLDLGGRRVLQEVDVDLQPGEMLGLIGPNGAGKSCLLRLLAGLHKPCCGSLQLAGRPLFELPIEERARQIAWLAQQGEIHWPISVETLVELGRSPQLAPWQGLSAKDRQAVERILRETALTELRGRPVDTLSGGERARALLARALVGKPSILLADEPLAALDPAHQLDMMHLLQAYCRQDTGIIVVLHDLRFAANFCRRLLLLHEGLVVAAGPPSDVLTAENLASTYQIEIKPEERGLFTLPWRRASTRLRS